MAAIEVGAKFPAVTLKDHDGAKVTLKSLLGGPLVLFIYPEAGSPSCTKEACGFDALGPKLKKLGARAAGLSPDAPADLAKFAAKHQLGLTLLSDEPGADGVPPVLAKIGAWGEKSMYGKTYFGVLRTTYLLDPGGKVVRRWDKVRVPGHAEAVLEAVEALTSA